MFVLAQGPRSSATDIVVIVGVVVFCAVIAVVLVRWCRRFSRADQDTEIRPAGFESIYFEARCKAQDMAMAYPELTNPSVTIEFHTYKSITTPLYADQHAHRLTLPALEALELVKLLHAYNLRSCWPPYEGVLLVPLLSFFEARKVRRMVVAEMSRARVQRDEAR